MPLRRRFAASCLLLIALCATTGALHAADDVLIWKGDHATGRVIMEDLAKQYAKEKKGTIKLESFSTVSGLDAVAQGSADIAGSARGKYDKRPEEAAINFVPVALDAAVLITFPKNPVTTLTLRQVFDIYYGRIKNWKDLGGLDQEINLYGIAAPLDGIEFSVRDLVFRNGDQRVAVPRLYLNTTKLEEGVAIDPAGLGLSTYASTVANKGVKALAIENIGASTPSIADGTYPLYITLYLAQRADSPKQEAINRFIAFLDSPPAKDILKKHALVPYSDATDAIARANARMAFIDAHLGREPGSAGSAVAAATPAPLGPPVTPAPAVTAPPPTPVAAPRASLEAKTRISGTSETAEQARENLARTEAAAEAKKAKAAATVEQPAPKKKKAVAKAEPKPKTEKKAASFDNVAADAKTAAKPATFGDVNAGAKTTDEPQKN
ncbi:MAG: substrate-binding domain-containing protein [Rhodanobacteraceae bacterium]